MADDTVYRNPRAWRVRVAQAAIAAFAATAVWLFISEDHAGMATADRIAVWFGLLFGLACFLAFEVYLRRYVLRIEREARGLAITTLATVHHARLVIRDGSLGRERNDRSSFIGAPTVNNSWIPLNLPGRWPPFIIDVTPPAKLHRGGLEAALRRASKPATSPKGRGDARGERR